MAGTNAWKPGKRGNALRLQNLGSPTKPRKIDMYQGLSFDWIIFDEVQHMPQYDTQYLVDQQLQDNPWVDYNKLHPGIRNSFSPQTWQERVHKFAYHMAPRQPNPNIDEEQIMQDLISVILRGSIPDRHLMFTLGEQKRNEIVKLMQEKLGGQNPPIPEWQQKQRDEFQNKFQQNRPIPRPQDQPFEPPNIIPNLKDLQQIKENNKGVKSFKVEPPPKNICIQFIGGPYNGEQRVVPRDFTRKDNSKIRIQQGDIYPIEEPGQPFFDNDGNLCEGLLTVWRYKLTFIPINETQFSDEQIVIGILQ